MATYKEIATFNSFTGNGGGDPDIQESNSKACVMKYGKRISKAKQMGKYITKLTGAEVDKWYKMDGISYSRSSTVMYVSM